MFNGLINQRFNPFNFRSNRIRASHCPDNDSVILLHNSRRNSGKERFKANELLLSMWHSASEKTIIRDGLTQPAIFRENKFMIPLSILRQKQKSMLGTFLYRIQNPHYPLMRNPRTKNVMHGADENYSRFFTLLDSLQLFGMPRQFGRLFEALANAFSVAISAGMKTYAPDRIACKLCPFNITFLHRRTKNTTRRCSEIEPQYPFRAVVVFRAVYAFFDC